MGNKNGGLWFSTADEDAKAQTNPRPNFMIENLKRHMTAATMNLIGLLRASFGILLRSFQFTSNRSRRYPPPYLFLHKVLQEGGLGLDFSTLSLPEKG